MKETGGVLAFCPPRKAQEKEVGGTLSLQSTIICCHVEDHAKAQWVLLWMNICGLEMERTSS